MWSPIRSLGPVLLLSGFVFLFFLLFPGGDREFDRVQRLAHMQFALKAAAQVAGLLIAFGALIVLFHWTTKGELPDLLTPGMCVLGGVLLYEPNWVVVVTFGLLAIAPVVERLISGRRAESANRAGDGSSGPG